MTIQLLLGLAAVRSAVPVGTGKTVGHVHPATKLGFTMAAIAVAVPLAVFWFNLPWARVAAHLPGRWRLSGFRLRHCRNQLQRLVRRSAAPSCQVCW